MNITIDPGSYAEIAVKKQIISWQILKWVELALEN